MSLTCVRRAYTLHKAAFPWEKLPFEIREQIFKDVNQRAPRGLNYFWWNGAMAPLIVALRPQPISYQHVLQWFAKENFYFSPLFPTPEHPIMDLTKDELAVITEASIDISRLMDDENYKLPGKPTFFTDCFLDMTALRSVSLFFDFNNRVWVSDLEDFITQFPFWLQGCKKLSEVQVEIPTSGLNNPWRNNLMQGILKRAFRKTGVLGEFVKMVASGPEYGSTLCEAELWVWKATEGRYMDWSQDIGWQCSKRCSVFVPPAWNFWDEWCGLEFRNDEFFVDWWENPNPAFELTITSCRI